MEKVILNYDKLRGLIRENFKTQANYANFLGISEGQLYKIFNCETYFNQSQIIKTANFVGSTPEEIYECFFKQKVEKTSTEN